jgi:hypothetical protein
MTLDGLNLFWTAKSTYEARLHSKNSAGAADKKAMWGQNAKGGYKPGLIACVGDYYSAHIGYYLAVKGWDAVSEVRRATGWSFDRIKSLLIKAIQHINWLQRRIGRRLLSALNKKPHRGAHFLSTVFSYAARKENVANTKTKWEDAAPFEDDADDMGNPIDDGDGGDEDDDGGSKKGARAMAYSLLAAAKKHARRCNQRYAEIMNTIDAKKLIAALSKGRKNGNEDVAEKMSNFLSSLWEISEKTGRFAARNGSHPQICDAPPETIIRHLIGLIQSRWIWDENEERPKVWRDLTKTEDGKERLAKLTRPISHGLKTRTHSGRTAIVGPVPDLVEHFFGTEKSPPREHLKFFVQINDNGTETITCQRLVHLRHGVETIPLIENSGEEHEIDRDIENTVISDLRLDTSDFQRVARELGIAPELLTAARFGDARALAVVTKAGRDMTADTRDRLMDLLKPDNSD